MVEKDEAKKICLEFADFPGADRPWLIEKAQQIEEAMSERLDGVFLWHSVVAEPEISGFRVFLQVDPESEGIDPTVPDTLVEIIREIACEAPPGDQNLVV